MKLTQEQIDRIHRISDRCIKGIIFGGIVVLFLKPDIWFWWVAGILLAVAIVVNTIFSHWATDEEKEERKAELKEVLREVATETISAQHPIFSTPDVYDPFVESVTEDQKKAIEQLLHDLPSHREKRDVINMSVVSRFLTALVELEIISKTKSADLNELRIWVEKVTGKQAPEQFRFNDAFPSTYKPGIKKAKEQIKHVLKI